MAKFRPGREQEGALIALVDDLRKIRADDQQEKQVIFVYDDPKPGDPEHAVLRAAEDTARHDIDDIRRQIRSAFNRRRVTKV